MDSLFHDVILGFQPAKSEFQPVNLNSGITFPIPALTLWQSMCLRRVSVLENQESGREKPAAALRANSVDEKLFLLTISHLFPLN